MTNSATILTSHILLADDDQDDRMLFVEALAQLPYFVRLSQVEDGDKLMRFLSSDLPDLIFLDINMPLKNGVECLNLIRKDKRLSSIPVIMYSTSKNPVYINKTFELGANGYVVKPNYFSSTIKLLQRVLLTNWKSKRQILKDDFIINVS